MEIRGVRSPGKAAIGALLFVFALVLFGFAISPSAPPPTNSRVIAAGFPVGSAVSQLFVWGEHLDPIRRHNARDVDPEAERVFRLHVVVSQSPVGEPPIASSLYLVGITSDQVFRCGDADENTPAPVYTQTEFDLIEPVAQRAVLDYFTDPERHGDVIDSPSWDAGESISDDDAKKAARRASIVKVTGTPVAATVTADGGEKQVVRQRYSCDLAAEIAWSVDGFWPLPDRRIYYQFPAISARSEGVADRTYVEVSSQHLFDRKIGEFAVRSELGQSARDNGQLYLDTSSNGTEAGEAGQQLRRVAVEFTPQAWTTATQAALFLAGILASLATTLIVGGLSPLRLHVT
ncbi:hypothetical protein FLP10_11235 [Agromyces intestinalis]|uniref:Uncharacterized protein n=1 Tax=Agromyces intestinalis TaxID=2592652 RepID=A0A5C1YH85_9MICO|nr:hypothetical protein [Agromyces intestinalis]QEO14925.1 hypothetical protein FLP10_11235 [Agromyces intestinalis]